MGFKGVELCVVFFCFTTYLSCLDFVIVFFCNFASLLTVGPLVLSTLLKAIVIGKDAYPNLIVHLPKCSR